MKIALAPRRRQRTLDDALLPLVNIVFLLMVFFLFAGHWGAAPARSAPRSASQASVRAADAVLELKADLHMQLAGDRFADDALATRAARYQGRPLDLRAEASVPASRVLRAMSVLQQAGVKDLRLLAVRDRNSQ